MINSEDGAIGQKALNSESDETNKSSPTSASNYTQQQSEPKQQESSSPSSSLLTPTGLQHQSAGGASAKRSGSHVNSNNTGGSGSNQTTQQVPISSAYQMEHFNRIKDLVKKAISARHTFMIHGRSRIIRECLLSRGWCEKFHKKNPIAEQQLGVDSSPAVLLSGIGDLSDRLNERLLISRMLGNHTVDFLWNAGSEWTGWPSQDNKTTIFNRYTRATFTSKVGLCSNVRQMHWFYEAGIANTLFPRCYNISQPDQMHAFIEDYRMTACLGLLKWLVDKVQEGGEQAVRAPSGIVPLRALDFAISRCSDFIGSKSHEDLDQEFEKIWSHQWEQFVGWYCKLLHGHALFVSSNVPIHKYLLAARHLLKKVKKYWPQLDMDGTMNIWILKPGNKSRGRGIILMNKLDDILAKVNPTNKTTDTRFVIQKYIERPLLICDTKFDIRQWFIVTNAQPLTLWMYRESYLRFCSQKFSLIDFHESIHLSNNAVQCKYKNSPDRDDTLPSENMWDVTTFKEFLKCRGDGDAWENLIYPGMKQGLVGSLLASQEAMDRRKNSFELYGADFMVMEDYSVWLIEINSHPDMSNSTSVTTKLCRKAMEDIIKVVVDYRENPSAETGDFELVYKQKMSSCQSYLGTGLFLHGTRLALDGKRTTSINTNNTMLGQGKRDVVTSLASIQAPNQDTSRVGPVLVDLIEALELQLDHEFYEYLKLRSGCGLSRQLMPQNLMPNDSQASRKKTSANQRSPNQQTDIETNTNLLLLTSQTGFTTSNDDTAQIPATTTPASRNLPGKSTKFVRKSYVNKKNSKHRDISSPVKNSDLSTANQQKNKALTPKIINLHKDGKIKHTPFSNQAKLFNVNKMADNLVLGDERVQVGEKLVIKNKKTIRKLQRIHSTKAISSIPSRLKTLNLGKEVPASQSATSRCKLNFIKKRNRAKSTQFFVDVTDMYAIGLAVNK